ncbi:MAG: hypothetical protein KKG47_02360 [Proteobacteria bacterium]|nr:hypothetical protein [Pseudomonadota bacterium]MBU1737422.1 hypothetical protein [Pseudomonadota bacterium]
MAYKIHWHVLLTHFPLSLFGVAFFFQALHLFVFPECFELATNIVLVGGTISLIPTTITGLHTWKQNYKSANVPLFRKKITIAVALLAISSSLVVWRIAYIGTQQIPITGFVHWFYLAGITILILGAGVEGFYGGQLNHH